MDRILIILKKENGPRASSASALGLNTIIFKHVYWYMQQTQVSVYRTIGPLVLLFTETLPTENQAEAVRGEHSATYNWLFFGFKCVSSAYTRTDSLI